MDDKSKKTLGIALGGLALVGLGIGLSKLLQSKPTHKCDTGYHWDKTQQACMPDTVPPEDGTCQTGYHFDEAQQTCVADIVTPPDDSWISKMPPLPAASTPTFNVWGDPIQPTGEKYWGHLDKSLIPMGEALQGWIPGFVSEDPDVEPYSWVKALAPMAFVPPTLGGSPSPYGYYLWIEDHTGEYANAPILQRHLSIDELGGENNLMVPEFQNIKRGKQTLAQYKNALRLYLTEAGYPTEAIESYMTVLDAGIGFNTPYLQNFTDRRRTINAIPYGAEQLFSYKDLLPYFILDRIYFGGGWPAGYGGWENGDGLGLALKDGPLPFPEYWTSRDDPSAKEWGSHVTDADVGKATHPYYSDGGWDLTNADTESVGDLKVFYNNYQGMLYVWQFVDDNPLYRVYPPSTKVLVPATAHSREISMYNPPNLYWKCIAYGPYYDPAYY